MCMFLLFETACQSGKSIKPHSNSHHSLVNFSKYRDNFVLKYFRQIQKLKKL